MSDETPIEEVTLAEVLRMALDARLTDLHVAMPAKVDSYDASAQTVKVTPCLNRSLPDGQGNYTTEQLPQLSDVPVCFQRAGGFFVSFPIQQGDYVMLIFAERNIGAWRATGDQGDPGDIGMHTLDGAIAIPGVYPDSGALGDASDSSMKLGKDGTPAAQIELTDALVKLGGGDQFVALANLVNQNFNVLYDVLNTIFGSLSSPIVTPAAGSPDPVYVAIKAALAAQAGAGSWPLADTDADNVKAT